MTCEEDLTDSDTSRKHGTCEFARQQFYRESLLSHLFLHDSELLVIVVITADWNCKPRGYFDRAMMKMK